MSRVLVRADTGRLTPVTRMTLEADMMVLLDSFNGMIGCER